MWKLLLPVLVLLGLIAVPLSFNRTGPRAELTIVNKGDVTSLDLQTISWMQDLRVARMAFEGLVTNDVFDWNLRPTPAAADHWQILDDGKTYIFHVRPEAAWSNGAPLLPSHFLYAWRRALLAETGSDYIKQFQLIRGGRAFTQWRLDALRAYVQSSGSGTHDASKSLDQSRELWQETCRAFDRLVGVVADDHAGTLRVELERPCSYFLDLCAFPQLFPLYPPLIDRYMLIDPATGQIKVDQSWCKPETIVSNGPFALKQWHFKREMRFEVNPHWWNVSSLNVRTVCIPSIEDPNAQVLAFRSGAIDWASDVDTAYRSQMLAEKAAFYAEHAEELKALQAQNLDPIEIDRRLPPDPRNRIVVTRAFGTYYYNFNCRPQLPDGRLNPMADPRVRRALALATDRRSVVEDVRRSGEPMATTLVPPGAIPSYQSPAGLPTDFDRARAELAAAGFPGGRDFPTIEILFNTEGGHDLIAQAVSRAWERELGVHVQLQEREIKVFRDDLKNGNFMIARGSWFGDYGDPTTFLNIYRTGDGNNDTHYSSSRFDSLMDQADQQTDSLRRMALLHDAEQLLVEQDFPNIPIFGYMNFYLFDPHRLTGVSAHPRSEQHISAFDILGDRRGSDTVRTMHLSAEGGT